MANIRNMAALAGLLQGLGSTLPGVLSQRQAEARRQESLRLAQENAERERERQAEQDKLNNEIKRLQIEQYKEKAERATKGAEQKERSAFKQELDKAMAASFAGLPIQVPSMLAEEGTPELLDMFRQNIAQERLIGEERREKAVSDKMALLKAREKPGKPLSAKDELLKKISPQLTLAQSLGIFGVSPALEKKRTAEAGIAQKKIGAFEDVQTRKGLESSAKIGLSEARRRSLQENAEKQAIENRMLDIELENVRGTGFRTKQELIAAEKAKETTKGFAVTRKLKELELKNITAFGFKNRADMIKTGISLANSMTAGMGEERARKSAQAKIKQDYLDFLSLEQYRASERGASKEATKLRFMDFHRKSEEGKLRERLKARELSQRDSEFNLKKSNYSNKSQVAKSKMALEFSKKFQREDGTPITANDAFMAISNYFNMGMLPQGFTVKAPKQGERDIRATNSAASGMVRGFMSTYTNKDGTPLDPNEALVTARDVLSGGTLPKTWAKITEKIKNVNVRGQSLIRYNTDVRSQMEQLKKVLRDFKGGGSEFVGPIQSMYNWLSRNTGLMVNPRKERFIADTNIFFNDLLSFFAGKNITGNEMQRMKTMVPTESDNETTFEQKMLALERFMVMKIEKNNEELRRLKFDYAIDTTDAASDLAAAEAELARRGLSNAN